jgi:hypothetical protein
MISSYTCPPLEGVGGGKGDRGDNLRSFDGHVRKGKNRKFLGVTAHGTGGVFQHKIWAAIKERWVMGKQR